MMYSEFLELTGLSEKDINFHQYQSDREPAYAYIESWQDKEQFCEFFRMFGYDVVCEISGMCKDKYFMDKTVQNLEQDKNCLRNELAESLSKLNQINKIIKG